MENLLWVKICGVRSEADAASVFDAGADAVGLNFAPSSPRFVAPVRAREIVTNLGSELKWVGVFVDASRDEILRTVEAVGLDFVQLHGHEDAAFLESLGVPAFKAMRIGDASDVEAARRFPGELLLVDAKSKTAMGGTGETFDWTLLGPLTEERQVVLAGGLRPENVRAAVERVRPFGVDTASGVESSPGVKDPEKVAAFVREAREGARRS